MVFILGGIILCPMTLLPVNGDRGTIGETPEASTTPDGPEAIASASAQPHQTRTKRQPYGGLNECRR